MRLIVVSPEANLFVFNLPPEYDDDKLRELFSPFGEILSAKVQMMNDFDDQVIFEKETNTSKGYGFVNFYNEEDAKKAIKEMDGKVINKKKLTVQVKKPKSRQKMIVFFLINKLSELISLTLLQLIYIHFQQKIFLL